jgi:hypothetical protein
MTDNTSASMRILGTILTVSRAYQMAFMAILLFAVCVVSTASDTASQIRVDSPYANDAPWDLLRGQLHCHSIQDINKVDQFAVSPTVLAQQYCDLGFDFAALTNHYEISRSADSCSLTWAPRSIELTPDPFAHGLPHRWPNQPHVLAIGLDDGVGRRELWRGVRYFDRPVNSIKQRVRNIHERHGLALVAHPDEKGWRGLAYNNFSVSVEQLMDLYLLDPTYRPDGISVYNSGGCGHNAEAKWDALLAKGGGKIKAWGFVEEDYHPHQGYAMGKAWVAVPGSRGDTWDTIETKLRAGDYYSYWTQCGAWPAASSVPRLRVTVDSSGACPSIRADVQDPSGNPYSVDAIRFIGCSGGVGGKTLQETAGSSARHECTGSETYVRVRVLHKLPGGLTLNIASQPMFISSGSDFAKKLVVSAQP